MIVDPLSYIATDLEQHLIMRCPSGVIRSAFFKLERGRRLNSHELHELGGKDSAAKLMFKGISYDVALPQDWLNYWANDEYETVMRQTVWAYSKEYKIFGAPAPVTEDAYRLIHERNLREAAA